VEVEVAPAAAPVAAEEGAAAEQEAAEAEDRSEAYLVRIEERTPRPPTTRARVALTSISPRMRISPLATPARSGM